jgi:hypothetical protein
MRFVLPLVLAALPSIAAAAPTVYICDTGTERTQSILQDQIAFAYDAASDTISVSDAVIVSETGGPIAAKINSDNTTRLVFTWTLKNLTNSTGQVVTLDYRAVFFKADNRFDLSIRPRGYDNSFQASGSCARDN